MKCIKCDEEMVIDDQDVNFPGNCDYYYICKKCNASCIRKVRFYKDWVIEYYDETGKLIKRIINGIKQNKTNNV